jgi:hypothetical protein
VSKYANVHLVAVAEDGSHQELLHPGEPFFLIRGQDQLATVMVAMYKLLLVAEYARLGKAPATQKLALDRKQRELREWQSRNPGLVKVAD